MHDTSSGKMRGVEYLMTVWVIVTINFFLPRAMPGDPFLHLSADTGEETARFSDAQRQYYIEYYGLNRPVARQYLIYLKQMISGDLGESIYFNEPVNRILVKRLPWTLFLVLSAVAFSTIIGVALGGLSAWFQGRLVDGLLYAGLILVSEIPAFLLGLLLLFVFAARLDFFPLSGAMTHFKTYGGWWERAADILHHAVLPVISLTLVRIGGMYLLSRGSLSGILNKDYIRTAWAKGITRPRILFFNALRNALLPIATRVFLSLGSLIGGAILVENVFSYPGLGQLMREAVIAHDYPLVQGIFLLMAVGVLSANFLADHLYHRLDPRVGEPAFEPGAS